MDLGLSVEDCGNLTHIMVRPDFGSGGGYPNHSSPVLLDSVVVPRTENCANT